MNDNIYYTYVYFDPRTNEPFYVGKGKGDRGWRFKGKSKQVNGRIRKLHQLNLEPVIRARTEQTEHHALLMEELLIRVFGRKDTGNGPLFNHTFGGECGVQMIGDDNPMRRPDVAAKQAARMKGRPKSDEHRAKLSAAKLGNSPSQRPEVAAKIKAAHLAKGDNHPSKRPEVIFKMLMSRRWKKILRASVLFNDQLQQ
jgi:hypothetical protein